MMKMTKRMISLLLCAVLVCCMLPAVQVSASGLEATGLSWGAYYWYNEDGSLTLMDMPGTVNFYGAPNTCYMVDYYMMGDDEAPVSQGISITSEDGKGGNEFLTLEDLSSGTYYFKVTPMSEDFTTPIGNSVTSDIWVYTKPASNWYAPTNLYWSWPYAYFTPAEMLNGMTGMQVEFFFAEDAGATPESIGWVGFYSTYQINYEELYSDMVEYFGAGYYYFRARTLSTDIGQYNHSAWSELSAPYHCGTGFMDVDMGAYYAQPVLWAVENGITTGLDATHFGPDATCTRGQIVTFLWRAKGSPEPKSSNNPFYDVSSSDYFYKAVLWAVEEGITSGMSATSFAPNEPCTRGQVATFLWRAEGQPKASAANSFYDVAAGAYYYDAVLWAVENQITNGVGPGSFAPDAPCTRGQIVTFLDRTMN